MHPASQRFQDMFLGYHPESGVILRRMTRSTSKPSVCAWDILFCVPRDIALLYGVVNKETKNIITQIHRKAVSVVEEWIQDNVAFTRTGKGGKTVEKVSLIVAHFEFLSGAGLDPYCYTHSLFFNAGVDSRGVSRTVYEYHFIAAHDDINTVYESTLRASLEESIGISFRLINDRYRQESQHFKMGEEMISVESVRESSDSGYLIKDILQEFVG